MVPTFFLTVYQRPRETKQYSQGQSHRLEERPADAVHFTAMCVSVRNVRNIATVSVPDIGANGGRGLTCLLATHCQSCSALPTQNQPHWSFPYLWGVGASRLHGSMFHKVWSLRITRYDSISTEPDSAYAFRGEPFTSLGCSTIVRKALPGGFRRFPDGRTICESFLQISRHRDSTRFGPAFARMPHYRACEFTTCAIRSPPKA